jgi:phage terminase large subunit
METSNGTRTVEQFLNRQFYDVKNTNARFRIHQGGTRSGKTYAICQYLAYLITTSTKPLTISIIRKTLPALKGSVQRDFLQILEATGIYWKGVHNKSENTFRYNGHLIEFLSVDEPQKIRGRKRDIAYLNEGNELLLEDFRQINMRTTGFVIIDFNPSDPIHWIYDELITREDCDTWITTYKDNKFLSAELVNEIERMRERDPDYWRVYGDGQRAVFSKRQIFSNWGFISINSFPKFDDVILGLDYGYSNDPTAIVEVYKQGDTLYLHEICYATGMTNQDIINLIKENGHAETLIIAESAEPKSNDELKRSGLWVKPAIKGTGSVNAGISLMKEFNIIGSEQSKNLKQEYLSYYWQELKDGTIINKPLDKANHLMDAARYAIYSEHSNKNSFFVI